MSLEKIDIRDIFRDQARTLVDWSTGKPKLSDRVVHWGVPFAAFGASWYMHVTLTRETVGIAITALAVIVGLLFNLLVTASTLRMANRSSATFGDAKILSKQILVNIEYAIVVAFLAIAVVMPSLLPAPRSPAWLVQINGLGVRAVGPAFVGLTVAFTLALLMVLRRMHFALTKNLELEYDAAPDIPARKLRKPDERVG